MAQLSSPGVAVTVINESFYTPAGQGTVPLVILASAENKQNSSNTGIAPATLKSNVNNVYLLTSQKDVSTNYGTSTFMTDSSGNPIHAGEQNEYGIQTLYSFLGVSNKAYALRADIDLSQLSGHAIAPVGNPINGSMWQDTVNTHYGIFEWDGISKFVNKTPMVLTDPTQVTSFSSNDFSPASSIGAIGSYAIVSVSNLNKLWYKMYDQTLSTPTGVWMEVGNTNWRSRFTYVTGTTTGLTTNTSIASSNIYTSNAGATNSGTTITVNSTTGLTVGMVVTTSGGTGAFAANTTVSSITDSTTFVVSTQPSTTFSGSVIVTGATSFSIGCNGVSHPFGLFAGTKVSDLITSINGLSLGYTASLNTSGSLVVYGTISTNNFNILSTNTQLGFTVGNHLANPKLLSIQPHTQVPTFTSTTPVGSIWIKTTNPNMGANWVIKQYNSSTNLWNNNTAPLYANNATALNSLDPVGGGMNLPLNTLYVKYNDSEVNPTLANFKVYRRSSTGVMTIQSKSIITSGIANVNQTLFTPITGTYTFTISESLIGNNSYSNPVSITFNTTTITTSTQLTNLIASSINNALVNTNIIASVNASNQLSITNTNGGDIKFSDGTNTPLSKLFIAIPASTGITPTTNFYSDPDGSGYVASLWTSLTGDNLSSFITSSPTALIAAPTNGQIWYDTYLEEIDILVNSGSAWQGYLSAYPNTNPSGPIISYSAPTLQVDGTPLVDNDLWICTSDLENYPLIYEYDATTQNWDLVDTTDSTTPNGIIFHDARWNSDGTKTGDNSIVGLLTSNFVDFDAPDPALYPQGIMLWNLRRSGFNVKKYVYNYVDITSVNTRMSNASMSNYDPNRWISISPNQDNGTGTFGRKSQRSVVIKALIAAIETNPLIRDNEGRMFDLIVTPGYPEVMNAMVNLNIERGQTAQVIADSPARLLPDSNSLYNWGTNQNGALVDGDEGLITIDSNLGVFYPWGYTTDNFGNNIVVPPSYMILKTIALSDQVSYKWFSFAGTRRGKITNATATGYIDNNGEFQIANLTNPIRNTMASIQVNPITYINGSGICNFGQYSRDLSFSATNRINVSRLVQYLRVMLALIAKPFLEEPNDKITRDEIKQQIEKFLLELVAQRALNDFIVVCDKSNNTPTTIDRSELWVDIAIEPVKAVEFIYIPVRLENTGTIQNIANM